jgi:hypothetical protein
MRKRSILAKIESSYGSDSSPTGAANAILIKNLNVTPMEMNLLPRDNIKPYLGNNEEIPAYVYGKLDFEVELAGAGTAGTAAPYGPLLRGCGLAETLLAAASSGTAAAGSTTTITLAAGASAVDNAYNGMTINLTGGTGSGQSAVIKSYVGSTKVATVTANWTTPPDATSQYTIPAQAVYQPISSSFESLSIYFNIDGVLHKMLGARGSVQFMLSAQTIPKMKFSFLGVYQAVADSAAPTVTLTGFQVPLAVTNVNTSGLNVIGFTGGVMSDLSVDMANNVVFRSLVGGSETVVITDRKPKGSITIEATTVASKDWWTAIKTVSTGVLSILHGTTTGNKCKLDGPRMQLNKPQYQDKDGIAMLQMGLDLIPVAGNDEFVLSVQ